LSARLKLNKEFLNTGLNFLKALTASRAYKREWRLQANMGMY